MNKYAFASKVSSINLGRRLSNLKSISIDAESKSVLSSHRTLFSFRIFSANNLARFVFPLPEIPSIIKPLQLAIVFSKSPTNLFLLVIKQYETFFEQQKHHNKKLKAIPTKTKSQLDFDYDNLLKYFNKFDNAKRETNFRSRLQNYKEAKKVLDEIADIKSLSQKQFEPLLDTLVGSKDDDNLWHSGSLFRLRKLVYPYFKEFQELVRYIRNNKTSPASIVFKGAKESII